MYKKLHHEVVITTKPPITLNYFKYVQVFISYFRPYRYYILKISHKVLVTMSAETIFFSFTQSRSTTTTFFLLISNRNAFMQKYIFSTLREQTRYPFSKQESSESFEIFLILNGTVYK